MAPFVPSGLALQFPHPPCWSLSSLQHKHLPRARGGAPGICYQQIPALRKQLLFSSRLLAFQQESINRLAGHRREIPHYFVGFREKGHLLACPCLLHHPPVLWGARNNCRARASTAVGQRRSLGSSRKNLAASFCHPPAGTWSIGEDQPCKGGF